ncbi:hypothetical protein PG5_16330 [Pseudomonas sp. G5(2012)]|nr:hypothetical protein PG5_16330 [Pseudomonas sp. G5(2012)]
MRRYSPIGQEVRKLIHQQSIGLVACFWRLKESAAIASAGIKKPIEEIGTHSSTENGSNI